MGYSNRFNVQISDIHFQEVHHALGCPWPDEIYSETYRNYFCVGDDTEAAARMKNSSHWTDGVEKFGYTFFHVTDEGRAALHEYIAENLHVPERYALTFKHHEGTVIVAAKSRSAAKYAAYIQADIDWPFLEYAAEIKSIRRYHPTNQKDRK